MAEVFRPTKDDLAKLVKNLEAVVIATAERMTELGKERDLALKQLKESRRQVQAYSNEAGWYLTRIHALEDQACKFQATVTDLREANDQLEDDKRVLGDKAESYETTVGNLFLTINKKDDDLVVLRKHIQRLEESTKAPVPTGRLADLLTELDDLKDENVNLRYDVTNLENFARIDRAKINRLESDIPAEDALEVSQAAVMDLSVTVVNLTEELQRAAVTYNKLLRVYQNGGV